MKAFCKGPYFRAKLMFLSISDFFSLIKAIFSKKYGQNMEYPKNIMFCFHLLKIFLSPQKAKKIAQVQKIKNIWYKIEKKSKCRKNVLGY